MQGGAGMLTEGLPMALQKVPIQRGEGAGIGACRLLGPEGTARTMATHTLQILAAGNIGFGGEQATVGVLRHPQNIGHFHPVDGIHIDRQKPFVHGLRTHTQEQGKKTGNHEALDVMGVAGSKGALQHVAQTGHFDLSRPIPSRQGLLCG